MRDFILDRICNGLREVPGQPGFFQVVVDNQEVGDPIRGFALAMAELNRRRRIPRVEFPDGVESAGAAQRLQGGGI